MMPTASTKKNKELPLVLQYITQDQDLREYESSFTKSEWIILGDVFLLNILQNKRDSYAAHRALAWVAGLDAMRKEPSWKGSIIASLDFNTLIQVLYTQMKPQMDAEIEQIIRALEQQSQENKPQNISSAAAAIDIPPSTIPDWVLQNVMTKQLKDKLTVAQWRSLEKNGFRELLGPHQNDMLIASVIQGIPMRMQLEPGLSFDDCAKLLISYVRKIDSPTFNIPDIAKIQAWLGPVLVQRMERSHLSFQDADNFFTALTFDVCKLLEGGEGSVACGALGEYAGKDIRTLWRNDTLSFQQVSALAQAVATELKGLSSREFPQWATGFEIKLLLNSFTPSQISILDRVAFRHYTQEQLREFKISNFIATTLRGLKLELLSQTYSNDAFEGRVHTLISLEAPFFTSPQYEELSARVGAPFLDALEERQALETDPPGAAASSSPSLPVQETREVSEERNSRARRVSDSVSKFGHFGVSTQLQRNNNSEKEERRCIIQ